MTTPNKLAEIMLEDDQPQNAPVEDRRALWDRAHKSLADLEALWAKRHENEVKMAFQIRFGRAMAYVDRDTKEARGVIRARDLASTDHGLFPHGSAARRIWRTFAGRYPNAVVGAHLKDGSRVMFVEPIAGRGSTTAVPTYEEFAERSKRPAPEDEYRS